jgi:hypothetical protein
VYPSGKYAAVACLLIKQQDGAVTISHGDGYVVQSGTWKIVSDKLIANSSVVFRTVSLSGNAEPEPSQTEQFKIERVNGHKVLHELGGLKYAPLPQFADVNDLAGVINSRAAQGPSPK